MSSYGSGQTLRDVLINGTGVERAFLCPVHGDSRPSASVNVVKGLWFCYTCGAHGDLEGVQGDVDQMEVLEQMIEEAKKAAKPKPIYTEAWLNQYDAGPIHPYWRTRFCEPAIKHFRLGYDPERRAVTYPLRTASGRVLGVVRRALDENEGGPKYRYPFGVDVSELLFNFSFDAAETVTLVEGALDAVALWEAGVTAFAIYGARMSKAQLKLLDKIGCTKIICLFDQDDAGHQAYRNVAELAQGKRVISVAWDRTLGKDVAELDVTTRLAVWFRGLDQLVQGRQDRVGSSVCASSSTSATTATTTPTLRLRGGSVPLVTTSTPARLRIVPPSR